MKMSNRVFDAMKWIALVMIPSFAVFYMAMAPTNGWPYPMEVMLTLSVVDLFLGVMLGFSAEEFNKKNPQYAVNLQNIVRQTESGDWVFPSNTYDFLVWIAQVALPALTALYGGLAAIWPMPYPEQVITTLVAGDAFLGSLLGFSSGQYTKLINQQLMKK